MVEEVLQALQPERGGTFIDGTVGLAGHARALLARGATRLIGVDRDPAALAVAREALHEWGDRVELVHADYRELARVLDERGLASVDGVLADLGVSSMQLDAEGRGFSFRRDEPLDMRMDPTRGETAADLVATMEEAALADVLFQFGEERKSRRIARAIVARRATQPLERTAQLADLIASVMPRGDSKIHPATRSFQAIRIFINRELADLEAGLDAAHACLKPGGRLAVISFHSLEDRIVKQFIARHAKAPPTNRRMPVVAPFVPTLRAIGDATKADTAELADLEAGLDAAHACLKPGGRLAVIAFHSLEDRIVKQFIARHAKAPPTHRRMPVVPSFVPTLRAIGDATKADAEELAANPRARSAVLRVAE